MKVRLCLIFFFVQLITAMEIEISITNQELILRDESGVIKTYKISTSKFGEGSKENSFDQLKYFCLAEGYILHKMGQMELQEAPSLPPLGFFRP